MSTFIHLRVHSAYSLLEGALPIKSLPGLCQKHGMPAIGVADTSNMFGALEFSVVAAAAGIQPIIACQLALDYLPAERPEEQSLAAAPIVAYAQNEQGYRNLMRLASNAYLHDDAREPKIRWHDLEAGCDGILFLTGGPEGPIGKQLQLGKKSAARAVLSRLVALAPDRVYVELHRHGVDGALRTKTESATENGFLSLADEFDLPLVAVNEVFFKDPEMYEAHDAMLCIAEGAYVSQDLRRRVSPENYFKSAEEMRERFADIPETIENTIEIAMRCAYRPHTQDPILPRFADDEVSALRRLAHEGLETRLQKISPAASPEEYRERLDFELGVIEDMGFPGYFLIVADFIRWAKGRNIPVGPGRGSGAGSLVAYALTITDLDPLRYQLLFERFLNPERVSMPDFDIDFCQDRRDEVITYVQNRYGRDRVAQIITFGKLQARAALRDVGRVLQMSFSQVDRLCKMVPNNPANPVTIAQAIADEPRLQEAAKEEFVVQQMLDIGQKIEGLYRHASTHAAGVVISDRPLHEITPLYLDPRSDMPATQFNMKWVEPAGLVKFDFLGLKTLTVIQNAIDMLTDRGVAIDINRIPLDDAKTFELYGRAETVAVFQVESAGMRDALRRLQPTAIEDIIALVALYRPGPMENIPKYCHVKHGREEPYYLHAILEPILKETQGIIVYQEQVMQIAQVMAGYSLGEADLLRRAMGKKIKEAMDLERPKFLSGAAQNGIDKAKAQEVWDLLEKFANYGFNKSHAAAYAFVSYQTAWLKANYPVEFMAAAMNLDMHNTEKLGIYRQELMRMKIPLLSPNINASEARFKPEKTADGVGAIRYALGALKNVGQDAMKAVARERDANGVFADIYDFAKRMDLKALGKRALENMVRSGVFDGLAHNRRQLMESLDTLIGVSSERIMAKATAQVSLFEGVGVAVEPPPLASVADWAPSDRLEQEAASIGFYISGHPLDDYSEALRRKRVLTFAELNGALGIGDAGARSAASISCRLSGVVSAKQERKSQKGTPFAFVQLSDPTGLYEIVVFSATLLESRALLEPGAKVVISVDAEREGDQVKLRAVGVQDIEQAVQGAESAGIAVHIGDPDAIISIRQSLEALCGEARPQPRDLGPPPRGFRTVEIVAAPTGENWEARLLLPDYYPIKTQARSALRAIPSVRDVEET